jgi:hypothetical protein
MGFFLPSGFSIFFDALQLWMKLQAGHLYEADETGMHKGFLMFTISHDSHPF